jgi:hypothetical protein
MSKIIRLTSDVFDSVLEDFKDMLESIKLSDGKVNYTKSFDKIERKAELMFTELAWLKMQALIKEFDKEVAWHGIARRGDDETKDEYIISDIMVYPQEVTGATVTTDQAEYQTWLYQFDNEVFNNIRFQGHSHVNMSTYPSKTDTDLYEKLLAQLDNTMFYIFMIWNKRGEKTIKIYDLAKNVLFETSDVTVSVLDDGLGIESLLKDAKGKVREEKYSYSGAYFKEKYNYYGDAGWDYTTVEPAAPSTPYVGIATTSPTSKDTSKDASLVQSKKRKGKMKKKGNHNGLHNHKSSLEYDGGPLYE